VRAAGRHEHGLDRRQVPVRSSGRNNNEIKQFADSPWPAVKKGETEFEQTANSRRQQQQLIQILFANLRS
jgi:hypothetical protein